MFPYCRLDTHQQGHLCTGQKGTVALNWHCAASRLEGVHGYTEGHGCTRLLCSGVHTLGAEKKEVVLFPLPLDLFSSLSSSFSPSLSPFFPVSFLSCLCSLSSCLGSPRDRVTAEYCHHASLPSDLFFLEPIFVQSHWEYPLPGN